MITLVRFLTVIFITGCSIIVCYRPLRRLVKVAGLYKETKSDQGIGNETRRLKYSNIEPDTTAEYD